VEELIYDFGISLFQYFKITSHSSKNFSNDSINISSRNANVFDVLSENLHESIENLSEKFDVSHSVISQDIVGGVVKSLQAGEAIVDSSSELLSCVALNV
jgi:vacuolar-type H+-ATPase subunit E/Vma4